MLCDETFETDFCTANGKANLVKNAELNQQMLDFLCCLKGELKKTGTNYQIWNDVQSASVTITNTPLPINDAAVFLIIWNGSAIYRTGAVPVSDPSVSISNNVISATEAFGDSETPGHVSAYWLTEEEYACFSQL